MQGTGRFFYLPLTPMSFRKNHALLIVDSCYSGTLSRGIAATSKESADRLKWIKRVRGKFSCTVLTSGSLEPVVDSGGGGQLNRKELAHHDI